MSVLLHGTDDGRDQDDSVDDTADYVQVNKRPKEHVEHGVVVEDGQGKTQ